VAQDYVEAVSWYKKAAEQGLATAQYNLGLCYEYGKCVEQNYKTAMSWYKKAAKQGYSAAQDKLNKASLLKELSDPLYILNRYKNIKKERNI
jgi:TPR repeat protein